MGMRTMHVLKGKVVLFGGNRLHYPANWERTPEESR